MFVIFTDETGDDKAELDSAVAICAPRDSRLLRGNAALRLAAATPPSSTSIPIPKYDQSVQWISVRQGPESYLPELVKIGSIDSEEPWTPALVLTA